MSGLMAVHHHMSTRRKKRRTLTTTTTTTTTTTRNCPPPLEQEQNIFYDWSDHPLLFQSLIVEDCREEKEEEKEEENSLEDPMNAPQSPTTRCQTPLDTHPTTPLSLSSCSLAPQSKTILGRTAKKVTFTTLQVREYNVTIGIHPICVDGLPLSLDWDYTDQKIISLEQEDHNSSSLATPKRVPRRLDYEARKEYLQTCLGMTEAELWVAEQDLWNALPPSADPCGVEEEMSCTSKVLHRASALVNFDHLFRLE